MKIKQYKRPPVIEAVIEIRFSAELTIECRKDEYYQKIRTEYSNIAVPLINNTDPYPLKPYRFMNNTGEKIIQFSINRFSIHEKAYQTFQKFKAEAIKYIELFCKNYSITNLKRFGLRYINHIPIERDNGYINLSRYLNFGYILPKQISNKPELFHTVLLTNVDDGRLRILIQSQEIAQKEIIILDFDLFYEGDIQIKDLQRYIDKAHSHTKDTFESLIANEYRKVMEGR